jgi:hypothetical protein
MLQLIAAALLVSPAATAPAPLDSEALRGIFLNGYNTYLVEPRPSGVIISNPKSEIFRPNGTWKKGRFGPEGWYAIEGNQLCVSVDGMPKHCRTLIPQVGNFYLLVDVADGSKAVLELSQVK